MMKQLWEASHKDKMSIQSLKHSDYVTTTTEKLAKTFKNFNSNVKILRNMFDWELPQWNLNIDDVRKEMLPEWFPTQDKVIIGWAGLTSHFEDLRRMHEIIKAVHDKYPNTYFVLAGMALKDTQVEIQYDENGKPMFKEMEIKDESLLYKNRVKNLYSDIDPNRIKIFDALGLEEYSKFYCLFDISLAYIEHNAFNSCKSEIKVVESIHYNCIPVFSEFGGYHDFWRNVPQQIKRNNCAISLTSPRHWSEAIGYWVENINQENTRNFVRQLKTHSDDSYDLNKNVEQRLLFYLEEIEKHEENQINQIATYTEYSGV